MTEADETVIGVARHVLVRQRVRAQELEGLRLVRVPGGGEPVDVGQILVGRGGERHAALAVRLLHHVDGHVGLVLRLAEVGDRRDAAPGEAELGEARPERRGEGLPLLALLGGEVALERRAERAAELVGGEARRAVAVDGADLRRRAGRRAGSEQRQERRGGPAPNQ